MTFKFVVFNRLIENGDQTDLKFKYQYFQIGLAFGVCILFMYIFEKEFY